MATGECSKHPGTKFENLTNKRGLVFRGCPACKAARESGGMPPGPTPKPAPKPKPSPLPKGKEKRKGFFGSLGFR